MKKTFLVTIIILLSLSANAQGNLNIGINAALPLGDVKEAFAAVTGAEVNYLFELSNEFKVGPSISAVHYFSDAGTDGVTFLPISAAARFAASDSFILGADLGYAVGISPDGNDGGFYYRPMIGYNISGNFILQAIYSGISVEGGTFSSVGIGGVFRL